MPSPSAGRGAPEAMRKAVPAGSVAAKAAVPRLPVILAQPAPMTARPHRAPIVSRGPRLSARLRRTHRPARARHPLNGLSRRRTPPHARSSVRRPRSVNNLLPSARVRSRPRIHLPALLLRQPPGQRRLPRHRRSSALRRTHRVPIPVVQIATSRGRRNSRAPRRHLPLLLSHRPRLARRLRQHLLRHRPLHRRSLARLRAHPLRPRLPHRRHDRARRLQSLPRQHQAPRNRSIPLACASTTCAASAGSVVKATA
jgi:hypothetical protein